MERVDEPGEPNKVLDLLPELKGEEMIFVQGVLDKLTANQARTFAMAYRTRRKDPQIILITALIGLIWVAGIHRFLMGQVGMGILYLLTGGLCFIGTIVDLVNHEKLAMEYNMGVAMELETMVRSHA
ncbi:TM2 domain-containing protein [bacterium SCSIO 12741]|nr:TM2 domain-containing protein [bacterium SCSIO 12741]